MEKYVRLSTYAKMHSVSVPTVMNWADKGLVVIVEIDKMKFVNLEKSKKENGR